MKKKLLLITAVFLCWNLVSQEPLKSDIAIFKDITQSFENHYYPGAIENVDLLQKEYPESVFLQQALVYKANSLINLHCYDEAIETLTNAINHMHTGQKGFTQCHYLLGQAYYNLGKFEKASDYFYVSTQLADLDKDDFYKSQSILYFAECYYNLERYDEIYNVYEYVIEHGKNYSKNDYTAAMQKLLICYNKSNLFNKTIDLYKVLDFDFFDNDSKDIILLYIAEAYEKLGDYESAYHIYCDVIKNGNENHAIIALKSAYYLSDTKKINVNPGNVFAQSTETFKNNKDLVNEFWIRLGIDEYNKKHYGRAESYFNNVTEDSVLIKIYKAKIILDTDTSVSGGKKAEEILLGIKDLYAEKNEIIKNLSDTYYSLLLQCEVQQEKWNNVPIIFKKIENPDKKSIYINSSYYYNKGDFEKVSPNSGVLYPSALSKLGKYEEAVKAFKILFDQNLLSKEHMGEYAKVLYLTGKYEEAYVINEKSIDNQKDYISGLCKINLGDFVNARKHFIAYIKAMSRSNDFNKLAIYYKGYSEYCLEDYKNAYATFVRFTSESSDSENIGKSYIRQAYYYAAISALQQKDYISGAVQAKNIIKYSSSEQEEIEGIIFTTEILTDSGKYDQAVDLLLPFANGNTTFSVEAMFRIAKIYEQQENAVHADQIYTKIYEKYPKTDFAEEAMYRAGEVYYFLEDFGIAYGKFNKYISNYPSGKFLDGALYFSGDCALKVGEINKSIMINKNMIAKFPESVYTYGTYKNLLTAYYEIEDYTNALEIADFLVKNYEDQASSDKIGTKLLELEKIVKGTDRRVVEKQSQFEKAGGIKTKDGRKIGAEIVKLYAENSYTQKYAYELAVDLLENQTDKDEMIYGAENAEFVGDFLRSKNDNKKAGEYYLKAAKYYRAVDNSLKAAAVLYSATEAFSVAGLKGDARETANLLKELYPETKYAQRVDKIVR